MSTRYTRIPEIQKGQPITAAWLNQVADALVAMIIGGPGITVKHVNNKIVIEAND